MAIAIFYATKFSAIRYNIRLDLMVHLIVIITCFHRKIPSFCMLLNDTITSYYKCDREIILLLFTGILSHVNATIFGCYYVEIIKCFWYKKCTKQCKYTNIMDMSLLYYSKTYIYHI